MENSKKVQKHFDLFSFRYKKNFSNTRLGKNIEFRIRLELIKDILSNASGGMLDCACGTGEITASVLKSGKFKIAAIVDISQKMLASAKNIISKSTCTAEVSYHNIDIFKFVPADNVRFDVILCLGLIAHTGNLHGLLLHLKSFLAPDGKILLQSSLAEHWSIRFTRFIARKRHIRLNGYDISYYKSSEIKKSVKLAGLLISESKRYCFGFPFGDRLLGKGNYWLEVFAQKFSSRYGSEGIFVITLPS